MQTTICRYQRLSVHLYMQNSLFSSRVVATVIASTHCAYLQRDGQAEFTWVAGYILRETTKLPYFNVIHSHSPIQEPQTCRSVRHDFPGTYQKRWDTSSHLFRNGRSAAYIQTTHDYHELSANMAKYPKRYVSACLHSCAKLISWIALLLDYWSFCYISTSITLWLLTDSEMFTTPIDMVGYN